MFDCETVELKYDFKHVIVQILSVDNETLQYVINYDARIETDIIF